MEEVRRPHPPGQHRCVASIYVNVWRRPACTCVSQARLSPAPAKADTLPAIRAGRAAGMWAPTFFRQRARDELVERNALLSCPVFCCCLERSRQIQRDSCLHHETLLSAWAGGQRAHPNRPGTSSKFLTFWVTMAAAPALAAVSSTISSAGSYNCDCRRKCSSTGATVLATSVGKWGLHRIPDKLTPPAVAPFHGSLESASPIALRRAAAPVPDAGSAGRVQVIRYSDVPMGGGLCSQGRRQHNRSIEGYGGEMMSIGIPLGW